METPYPSITSDTKEPSTWLMRTSFSRTVCYRLDGSTMSTLSFPSMEDYSCPRGQHKKLGTTQRTSQEELCHGLSSASISSQQSSEATFPPYSSELSSASPSAASTNSSKQLSSAARFESTSVASSPGKYRVKHRFFRSQSLPNTAHSKKKPDYEDCRDRQGYFQDTNSRGRNGIMRVCEACDSSWSNYFVTLGDEYAVEEAEDWMVDLSELYVGQRFASGAYSRLYVGKYKGNEVAVKVLKQPDDNADVSRRLERQFKHEVDVLSKVHHPNIVKFIGACRKPPVSCIITEYLALGSLRNYLHNQPLFSLSLKLALDMALDVARGMEYLHSQGVIHRDLKPQNLVIAHDLRVKITDFGVACFASDSSSMAEDLGTYRWMAPEIMSGKRFSTKADVYSFGMVLWELLTGKTPFEELSPVQAAFAVLNKHARPPLPPNCPSALGHLIHSCWATEPSKRPSFSTILVALEEMRQSSQLQQDKSITARPHRHDLSLPRLFQYCASDGMQSIRRCMRSVSLPPLRRT